MLFRNYLKIAFRNLGRYKGYSFINLFGLVTGMCVCLLVFIFVRFERGYDTGYPENIYRLCEIQQQPEDKAPTKIAPTRFPAAPAMAAEIPGIRDFTRIVSWEKTPLHVTGTTPLAATTFCADPSFFRVFGLRLIRGDTATALLQPGCIVLTQSLARRLFGQADPMGALIRLERRDTVLCRVTGILPDPPPQSHLQFEAVYSISTDERPGWQKDWTSSWAFVYLLLDRQTDIRKIEGNFPDFFRRHAGKSGAAGFRLFLQPVRKIHLYSADITHDLLNIQKFDGSYIPLLITVALLVLVLGFINYVNLNTARLMTRAKEVGIRKTNGAARKDIAFQFITEALFFSCIAFLLAFILALVLLPLIGRLTERNFTIHQFPDPIWLLIPGLLIIVTGVTAGLLPAIVMGSLQPVDVLKGKLWTGYRSPLRNGLVIVQFVIAIGLSTAALAVLRQLSFIQQVDLGFNKEAVIVVPVDYADRQKEETFMHQVQQLPGVRDISGAIRRIGGSINLNEVVFKGEGAQRTLRCASMYVAYNYLPFYKIPLLAGRNFSPAFGADRNSRSYIINETLANELLPSSSPRDRSPASLIGKPFRFGYQDSMGTIIGITRDFNFNSLHQRIEPLVIVYLHDYYYTDLSIRLETLHVPATIARIEQAWNDFLPGHSFSWYFLDNYLQDLYRSDTQTGILLVVCTVIAFSIACMGLISVAAFVIERRTKEIAVRKVLGATNYQIVLLLSGNFVKLVLVSIGLALPAAGWMISRWLQKFAYQAPIPWWMFLAVALAAVLLAILTVCLQALKAAAANPAKTIRTV